MRSTESLSSWNWTNKLSCIVISYFILIYVNQISFKSKYLTTYLYDYLLIYLYDIGNEGAFKVVVEFDVVVD